VVDPRRAGGPDELVAGSPDESAGRRRWLWAAGLVAAVVAVVAAQPELSLHSGRPAPPAPTPSRPAPQPLAAPLDGIHWQPRGDLVRDREFVRAAMSRVRRERPGVSRLFFAGHLPDGSRLVLAGTDVNRGMVATSVHALFAPSGVPVVGAAVSEATALTAPQQVFAWAAEAPGGNVVAVVMTRPGPVRFEVSARVHFDADGTPGRTWTPLLAENGVAVADLGPDADTIVTFRGNGPGVFALPLLVRVVPRVPGAPVLAVDGTTAPGYRGPDAPQLSRALRAGVGSLVDLDAAERRVLWSGAPWKQRRLALVLVTREDGQRFQALVGQQGDLDFPAGVRALPRAADERLPWLLEPFSPSDPTLLLCPTGPGSLTYRRAGRPARVLPVRDDGVAALVEPGPSPPSASGAEVTLRDPDGRVLLRTTLPEPGFDDPMALD
jgi:hypothetical protein